jgi:uncharacterized membrane protein
MATLDSLTLAAALGSGLVAGVFFAFSSFVMPALRRLPASEAIAAMQAINLTAVRPPFLSAFLGTAALSLAVAVVALTHWGPASPALVTGAALYLFGPFGITMAFNVPLNNALAAVSPAAPDAAGRWADYDKRWTNWNHVRTFSALAALAAFALGMHR